MREFGAGAGDEAALDDGADAGHDVVLVAGIDVAQVDLALGPRRHGVDALAAADQADIQGDAAIQVGQRVDRLHLARQLLDGADAGRRSCRRSGPPCR